MALQTMYPASNSIVTQISADIAAADATIAVVDITAFPQAPNYATIGTDNNAEVILYSGINQADNTLTGCLRGRADTVSKSWDSGTFIFHSWTSESYNTIVSNVSELAGISQSQTDRLDTHISNKSNPHGVTAAQAGAVPTTRTVNSKALSANITLTPSDIGLGNVSNEDWKTASLSVPADTSTNGTADTAAKSGTLPSLFNWLREKVNWILGSNGLGSKVPTTRTINSKALSANITLTPSDIGAAAPAQTYTATIPTSGWSSSAPYTVSVTVNGITSGMTPIIDIVLSATASTAKLQLEAWGKVGRITTATNAITVYCYEEKPTTAIPIQLKAVS